MRFDDRLNTVLAQPAANPHDRAVRWRQLIELIARASDLWTPPARQALAEIRSEAPSIDPQVRGAAARAVARPQLPVELVEVFAEDSIAVSAPVLAAVSLTPSEWQMVIEASSPDSLRFIRSLYPELPGWQVSDRSRPAEEAEFEPIHEGEVQVEPEPEPEPEQSAAPEPKPKPEPEPEPAPFVAPPPPPPPPPPRSQPSGPRITIPSISEVLARIENLKTERQFAQDEPAPQPATQTAPAAPQQAMPVRQPSASVARRPAESAAPLFRWECGPSGEIAWVEGVPRGALIGRSLANPGEHNGVDQRIQRAFSVRAPFREATLTVSGDGPASGEWKLSGVPAFEPSDGRFAGYRGVGVRAGDRPAAEAATPRERLDEDSLRELVHELKTPLNAIIGFAEVIDGQYLGPADTKYRDRAAEIVSQGRLLLSAIEDLDVAAQLRASAAAMNSSTDLNALLTGLLPDLKDRAARRGARFDLALSRTPAVSTLDRAVLDRLIRRFTSALIDVAQSKEQVEINLDCDVGQCLISASRPQAMRTLSEAQIFGRDGHQADVLASGFSLKLARGIAQTAGGDLRVSGDRIALVLPRRIS